MRRANVASEKRLSRRRVHIDAEGEASPPPSSVVGVAVSIMDRTHADWHVGYRENCCREPESRESPGGPGKLLASLAPGELGSSRRPVPGGRRRSWQVQGASRGPPGSCCLGMSGTPGAALESPGEALLRSRSPRPCELPGVARSPDHPVRRARTSVGPVGPPSPPVGRV